ncbi:MAG: two-component regulator propeller domain-containing protein [Acidobacteriota bacterium]|nr:two-component regulator propeller domain-containing protein [Acidobacteriota bacterium]
MFKTLLTKTLGLIFLLALAASILAFQTEQNSLPQTGSLSAEPTPTPTVTDLPTLNLHRWGAVTLFHGLPSDRVNAIAEDANGLMWFGTDNGLVRYDGRNVESVPGEALLPSRRILALKLDERGSLWIGTESGAARWRESHIQVLEATSGRAITAIDAVQNEILMVSQRGEIFHYIESNPSQLNGGSSESSRLTPTLSSTRLDPTTNPAQLRTPNQAEESLPLLAVARISSEQWAIGSAGRGVLVKREKEIQEIAGKSPRPFFVASAFAEGGKLWLGESANQRAGGLWLFSSNTIKRIPIETEAVRAIDGANDELWVGTNRRGVFLLKPEADNAKLIEHLTFENTAGGLRSNQINAVFRDREGVVWFGTDRGVCRYDRESFRAATLSGDSQSNYVRELLQASSGELWCGTNRGLFRLASPESSGVAIGEIENRSVYSLIEDAAGAIWAGTSGGLFVKTKDTASFVRVTDAPATEITIENDAAAESPETAAADPQAAINNPQSSAPQPKESVRAIASFRGQIYAAHFGRGIERIEAGRRVSIQPKLTEVAAQRAICLAAEGDEALWVGTSDGELWRYDGSQLKQVETPIKRAESLSEKAIRAMTYADQKLWLATSTGLFVREAETFRLVRGGIDAQDLLVKRDLSGREIIWCATKNTGLLKLLPSENILIRFDTEQGLSSQQAFALASLTDSAGIWVGTNRGIVRHQPSSVEPRLAIKRLVAEKIHQPEDLIAELALPHTQRSFVLEVAGIASKTFPSQFQYEFILQTRTGQLLKKVQTLDPQFAPGELPSGGYAIEVRSVSRDLVYSAPLKLRLRIQSAPFPWGTLFLAGLALVAVTAAVWAFRQQFRLSKTNRTLADTNVELHETRLRLASETETERSRIARDLHDQTLADLRHLLVLTDQLPAGAEDSLTPSPSEIRRKIESVSKEIRRICEDLSPSALQNLGFLPALEGALSDAVAQLPTEEKFAYEFICDPEIEDRLQLSEIEQIQLYRIVQEALNNVCRHAEAKQVRLIVRVEGDDLLIEVCDDGKGLVGVVTNRSGYGLANIRSRANLIGAQVSWQDAQPGCRFELRKPLVVLNRT